MSNDLGVQKSPSQVASEGFSGGGSEIPHKAAMEQSFGRDFSAVQAHTGPAASKANETLGSNAYAMGGQVAFKSASPSKALVAHELTHVVQQSEGPSYHGGGGIDTSGEAEANAVEAAVAAGRPASSVLGGAGHVQRSSGAALKPALKPVQLKSAADDDDKPALDTGFTTGMEFSSEGFRKSYGYTIWDKDIPSIPTGIPGVNWKFSPALKVEAKGGADWDGGGELSVGVIGEFGVGLSGGIPEVAEIYAQLVPSISGRGKYTWGGGDDDGKWELDVGVDVSLGGKIGIEFAGGIVDFSYQLFEAELIKFTGINWDQDGFHPEKFGLGWGKDVQDILDWISSMLEKAKKYANMAWEGMKEAGTYVVDGLSAAYDWATSW